MRTIILCSLLLASVPSWASENGYIHGHNHCFYFRSPRGWVADHMSGRNQGVPFVFYPRDSSWADAATVIYAMVVDKTEGLREPSDQVERTLQQFRAQYQSPRIKAQRVGAMKSKTGAVAEIYRFTGDQWGNTELVAYFTGKSTINFFVMSSRDANESQKNRKALEELAQSYREAEDCKPCAESPCSGPTEAPRLAAQITGGGSTPFDDALAAATANMESAQGKKYDLDFGTQFGERYADTMRQCTSTSAPADLARFDLLIRVARDGSVEEALIQPATRVATCLRERVVKGRFVKPPRGAYWVRIEMIFTP